MSEREKEIIDLLRGIRQDVADLSVKVEAIELHLKRQDKESLEVLASARRLTLALEIIDEEDGLKPLQN